MQPGSGPTGQDGAAAEAEQPGFLGTILSAESHFGRLGLQVAGISTADVRRAYRSVAIQVLRCRSSGRSFSPILQVHPDKCSDSRVTEAFQMPPEAFDVLCNTRSQVCIITAPEAN